MSNVKVGIIDCEISNLMSVYNAITFLGFSVDVVAAKSNLTDYSHLILPGVGSYREGARNLKKNGVGDKILEMASSGVPILGICLGMQLLSSQGTEHGESAGLGLIPGIVDKMLAGGAEIRLPHVGWNNVTFTKDSLLWRGLPSQSIFYFIHSYCYRSDTNEKYVSAKITYGNEHVVAVEYNNIFGVQWHPEKSQKAGLTVLNNFLKIC